VIIDVALSAKAMADISAMVIGRNARTLCSALTEALRGYGALVITSAEEGREILQIVKSDSALTQAERQEWSAVLEFLAQDKRIRFVSPDLIPLDTIEVADDLELARSKQPLLAVLGDDSFERLFPASDANSVAISANVEAAPAGTASLADQFSRARNVAAREVYAPGTARDEIWDELLAPLASFTKQVTIFDRYVFAGMYRREANLSGRPEHLEWFLSRLDEAAPPGTHVKVYGSIGYETGHAQIPNDVEAVGQLLSRRWTSRFGNIAQVELIATSGTRNHPHDRHLMFGQGMALDMASGLDRLAEHHLRDPFTFSYKWLNAQLQALRHRENAVMNRRPSTANVI